MTEFQPYYPVAWPRTDRTVADIAILGAGQSGLAILHGLKIAGIDNVALFDAAAPGDQGVWQSVARMLTLRTEKSINGPELGNAALSFKTWLTARKGNDAFEAIDRIPRLQWQEYLDWFSQRIGAEPNWQHRLISVGPGENSLVLRFETPDGIKERYARHLVIATGVDGFGSAYIPDNLRALLPSDRLWHTQDKIPGTVFRDTNLLIVGSSASAFDVASTALEQGARQVHQIGRNPTLAQHYNPGVDLRAVVASQRVFRHLSDEAKWAAILRQRARGNAPPQSIARARALQGHHLHLGVTSDDLTVTASGCEMIINGEPVHFDHVICGTGYRQGAHLRPEFADLASRIRTWRDKKLPTPQGLDQWNDLPDLGDGFQCLPSASGDEWVTRLHVFTFAAILNHGMHVGDIGTASLAVPRLVDHLATRLFEDARRQHEDAVFTGNTAFQNGNRTADLSGDLRQPHAEGAAA